MPEAADTPIFFYCIADEDELLAVGAPDRETAISVFAANGHGDAAPKFQHLRLPVYTRKGENVAATLLNPSAVPDAADTLVEGDVVD